MQQLQQMICQGSTKSRYQHKLTATNYLWNKKKDDSIKKFMTSTSCCKFTEVDQEENKVSIIYEVSTGKLRPFISTNLRKREFNVVHNVAHAGGKATFKILQ